jgi:hypothetical protein
MRENPHDPRILDIRLDSVPEFSVAIESCANDLTIARSPITVREATSPGSPFSDLRGKIEDQISRLWQTLQDGTFGLSGYNIENSQHREMPGQFYCYVSQQRPRSRRKPNTMVEAFEQMLLPPGTPASAAAFPSEIDEPTLPVANGSPILYPSHPPSESRVDFLPHSPMKMILITAGSGGTGKSTLARLLFELANFDTRDDVAMFDCDALGNRDFQKISPEKIVSMPIDHVDTMRRMVESAMEGKLVLADLPASCQDVLARDLNPDIIQSLRADEGLHWLPIHPVTAKAATFPAIKQWRTSIFGEAPSIIVISLKDGPVSSEDLDEIVRPQDLVLRMPVLDQSLASALDASNSTWLDILEGRSPDSHRMFNNPLVKRQLRFKRKECEEALFPLLRRIIKDTMASA